MKKLLVTLMMIPTLALAELDKKSLVSELRAVHNFCIKAIQEEPKREKIVGMLKKEGAYLSVPDLNRFMYLSCMSGIMENTSVGIVKKNLAEDF